MIHTCAVAVHTCSLAVAQVEERLRDALVQITAPATHTAACGTTRPSGLSHGARATATSEPTAIEHAAAVEIAYACSIRLPSRGREVSA